MRSLDPKQHVRFLAQHFDLVEDIYEAQGGCTEAELYRLVRRHRAPQDPTIPHIVDQLEALGIVEERPGATATFEMTQQLRKYFGYLQSRHRLGTPGIIEAYLDEIKQLGAKLEALAAGQAIRRLESTLGDLDHVLEQVRTYSREHRLAIIHRVIALKSNEEALSVRERFEIINELWADNLEPLGELVDVRKVADRIFDGLRRRLKGVEHTLREDHVLVGQARSTEARLTRMQRELLADYRESVNEVLPVYEALRRESRLARGAARLLEALDRTADVRALELVEWFALPVCRIEGTFSNRALEAYLHAVGTYEPSPPKPIQVPASSAPPAFVSSDDAMDRLRAVLPVQDALAWLIREYDRLPLREVLRLYGCIMRTRGVRISYGVEPRAYRHGRYALRAHPIQVDEVES